MKQIYQSQDWKSLGHLTRAQLVPVIEGLKPTTIVPGNWTTFPRVIEESGLDYEPMNDETQIHNPGFVVGKTEALEKPYGKTLTLPASATFADNDRITGEMLGYPKCCIDEFIQKTAPPYIQVPQLQEDVLTREEFTKNWQEVRRTFPEVFDYLPPGYTPCSADCEETRELASSWQKAIMENDPEAGNVLARYNRIGTTAPMDLSARLD